MSDPRKDSSPDSVNKKLYDQNVRHRIGLERLSGGVRDDVVSLLNEADDDIVQILENSNPTEWQTGRLTQIKADLAEVNRQIHSDVQQKLEREFTDLAQHEVSYQANAINSALPIDWSLTKPTANQLEAAVTSKPFQGRLLSEWVDSMEQDRMDRLKNAIQLGFTEGESIDQIVNRVTGTRSAGFRDGILEMGRRNAEAVVRTGVTHVSDRASELTYRNNSDLVKGVKIVATLDSRTTVICMRKDGNVHKPGQGGRPPFHVQCRTTTTPITKSFEELGLPFDEFDESTRASMDGQVPGDLTYGEWLRDQDENVVIDALGKKRAKLFMDGDLDVDRFTTDQSKKLTLSDLKSKESEAFEKAGIN